MSVTYRVNGFALDDPGGRWELKKATQFAAGVAHVNTNSQAAGGYGEYPPDWPEPAAAQTLSLAFDVLGASDSAVRANLSLLRAVLRGATTISQDFDGSVWDQPAKLMTMSDPEAYWQFLRTTALLRLPEVDWRQDAADFVTPTVNATSMLLDLTPLAGGTAPVRDAKILLTGPCAAPVTITDEGSGAWLRYNASIAAGTKVLIDCRKQTAISGTAVTLASTTGTDVTTNLLYGPQPPWEFFYLRPVIQAGALTTKYLMRVATATFTTGTTLFSVRARKALS